MKMAMRRTCPTISQFHLPPFAPPPKADPILNPIFRALLQLQAMPPLPLRPSVPAPVIWLVAAVATAQALLFWSYQTSDMMWLDPIDFLRTLPAVGMVVLALAFHRLLVTLGVTQRTQWAAMICVLPAVALNALYLGQCDTFPTAACVMAVAMALERRHLAMFAWSGIAIALETQAALVAPFLLALAIHRRVPIHQWFAAPAVFLVMVVPGLLAGWPLAGLAATDSAAPNLWSLVSAIAPAHTPQLFALSLAATLGAAGTYIAQMQVARFDRAGLVAMAALSVLLTAGLLPGMRAGDFLLANVLTLALAIARATRNALALAALVQLGSIVAIIGDTGLELPAAAIGALCMIAATWIAAKPLIAPHANDNRDGSHRIPPPHGLRGTLSFDMVNAPVARPRGE